MKNKTRTLILSISFAVLLLTFFFSFISSKVWDYDFWWHLASGRYIVETMSLPDLDPFSYVNNLPENQSIKNPLGIQFNLRQYWLAQVLFYLVHKNFGDAGIMILRGILLISVVLMVFAELRRRRVDYIVIFPLLVCVYMNLLPFVGERPVLFTILFTLLTFYLLEEYTRNNSRLILSLPPLMLLWSNLHGGFILGIIMIGTYLAGETINFLLKKGSPDRHKLISFYLVGLVAIASSAINPNGFKAFLALAPAYSSLFQTGIQEYASPFALYGARVSQINWWYIAMLVAFPVIIILRRRKMNSTYYILLGGLFYMSATALRYGVFYVSISAMVLGAELQEVANEHSVRLEAMRSRFNPLFLLVIFGSSLFFASGYLSPGSIIFGKATRYTVPEGAADFILKHEIKGNMFNDMGFGGYLIWRLYPGKKVFHDSRALNYMVINEYDWIMNGIISIQNKTLTEGKVPLWERLLDHYKVDFLVLSTTDAVGHIPALIFRLMENKEWSPVFYDAVSIVFVREKEENQAIIDKYLISKDKNDDKSLYKMLIVTFTNIAISNQWNPNYMVDLGEIFYNMENYTDALKAYEYADKRLPGQEALKVRIAAVRELLNAGKSKEQSNKNHE